MIDRERTERYRSAAFVGMDGDAALFRCDDGTFLFGVLDGKGAFIEERNEEENSGGSGGIPEKPG